jgi:predicted porin
MTTGQGFSSSQRFEISAKANYKRFEAATAYLKDIGGEAKTPGSSSQTSELITASLAYDFGILKPTYTFFQKKTNAQPVTYDVVCGICGDKIIYASMPYGQKEQYHQIGITAPITPTIDVYGNYMIGKSSASGTDYSSNKGDGYQIGARYALSKRTNLYAAYGAQKSSGDAYAKAYTLGLKHTF